MKAKIIMVSDGDKESHPEIELNLVTIPEYLEVKKLLDSGALQAIPFDEEGYDIIEKDNRFAYGGSLTEAILVRLPL